MTTGKLWSVLVLCGIGLLFFVNRSFVESQKTDALWPLRSFTAINPTLVTNTKHIVIIKGMVFDPAELHVHKGDTVLWINKDLVPHNITDFPKNRWTSGTLALSSSWEKSISNTFEYYCSIHPTMKGKIIVDP
ncbi:MAG: plastocyanin/azurin family copper-binding protein [Gelidibacter sp.]